MVYLTWIGIAFLFGIIGVLVVYNINLSKKLKELKNTDQKINNLNVLQDFINAISEITTTDEKIKKINNILIEKYEIKYSTIVIYDGSEYIIKASNVDKKHWQTLRNLQSEEVFNDSIQTATPKYITVENDEKLPYLKMEFARAKSAMFFPLYIDNIYIGYWIIEGRQAHEFDNVDTTILEVVKNNIISILKTIENQKIVENIVRTDQITGLKSAEFLYGKGRKIIDQYATSTVCLFKITNLVKINEIVSRKTGDEVIRRISEVVKESLAKEYIFVRYNGPIFAIVFSGSNVDGVVNFMKNLKATIETLRIKPKEDYRPKNKKRIVVIPKINVAISTYYKGTGLEGVTNTLEEFLNVADKNENNINCL